MKRNIRTIGERRTRGRIGLDSGTLVALCLAASACASTMRGLRPDEASITRQAIFVHRDGQALRPSVGSNATKFPSDTAYGVYLHAMMDSIRSDTVRRDGKHKILIRIHGGLNTLNGSLEASLAMRDSIRADASAGYFPIFVNWESGLWSSLEEHIFNTRRGEYYPFWSFSGGALAPAYLLSDLGQGLARAPIAGVRQLHNYITSPFHNTQAAAPDSLTPRQQVAQDTSTQTTPAAIVEQKEKRLAVSQQAQSSSASLTRALVPPQDITFSRFPYRRSKLEAAEHLAAATLYSVPPNLYVAAYRHTVQGRSGGFSFAPGWAKALGWIPLKPFAMYVVDALGTPSWMMMHRRTQGMFEDPNSFAHHQKLTGYVPPSGALTSLLDSLQDLVLTDQSTTYELTIIGHSMGAIVATEIARRRDSLPIDNLVFMAAAASMREFQVGVMPYLERHPQTQFYTLSLHPFADLRESHLLRLAPYGSLLEWIDAFYSRPETDFDFMMGKYNNVMQASSVFPTSIRGRVHIKGFGYNDGKGCGPDKNLPFQHGDFNALSVPFWRPHFWQPNQIGCEDLKLPTYPRAIGSR